jgi:hypothetical protein
MRRINVLLMSDTMGTLCGPASAFEIAAGLMRYSFAVVQHADNRPARMRQGAELRVRDRSADRVGP